METKKIQRKIRRHKRVRSKISGTTAIPRLCVSRTAKHIYAQLINDETGKTILSLSDEKIKVSSSVKTKEGTALAGKIATAYEVGKAIAKKALENKIEKVVFDRGGYKYHGRVKAVGEGAREGGLKF